MSCPDALWITGITGITFVPREDVKDIIYLLTRDPHQHILRAMSKFCLICNAPLPDENPNRRFCSIRCRHKNDHRRHQKPTPLTPSTTTRNCLKCRRPFKSWGNSNRMCSQCRADPQRELMADWR